MKHSCTAGWVLLVVGLCACVSAFALDPDRPVSSFHRTSWSVNDGAPPDTWAIAQTNDGWLWFGGSTGLYRFDGIRFDEVPLNADDPTRSKGVSQLLATEDGDLWIGYIAGGVSRLRDGQLTHFGAAEGVACGSIIAMEQDAQGAVWAPCTSGFLRFDGQRWERIGPDWNFPDGHAVNIILDGRDRVWVAGENEFFYLEPGARAFQRSGVTFSIPDLQLAPDGRLWFRDHDVMRLMPLQEGPGPMKTHRPWRTSAFSIFDRDGALWTGDGPDYHLVRIARPKAGLNTRHDHAGELLTARKGSLVEIFKTLLEDREGNVWVARTSSIERFRHTNVVRPPAMTLYGLLALAPANNGAVWVGGNQGLMGGDVSGLWKLDKTLERRWPELGSFSMLHKDANGALWLGGRKGIWRTDGERVEKLPELPEEARGQHVHQFSVDANGHAWATVMRANVYQLVDGAWRVRGGRDGLPANKRPIVQATDPQGRVWLVYDDGLVMIATGDTVERYAAAGSLRIGMPTALHFGRRTLIAGEAGVAVQSGDRFTLLRFAAEPAALESVTGMVDTPDGSVWLNGRRGAVRIFPGEIDREPVNGAIDVKAELFGADDGYPGTAQQIRPVPTLTAGTDGRLWFVGNEGIGMIDPAKVRRNALPPPLALVSITADGRTLDPAAEIALSAGARNLSIAYTGLSLSHPERTRFRYQLRGFDDSWIEAGTRREAFYTSLPPGEYDFHVAAANESGVWNEAGATVRILVPPTFVQTTLFKVLCVLAGIAILWLAYTLRVRQLTHREHARMEARLHERERIARELHDTLLQGMQGLILRFARFTRQLHAADPMRPQLDDALDRAEAMLIDGRDRVRELRNESPVQEALEESLRDAANGLASQFPSSTFHMDVSGAPQPLRPMVRFECEAIAIEALTNAFKHSGAPTITVAVTYGQRHFVVEVRDDGRGIEDDTAPAGKKGHYGIRGMRERASRIDAHLSIEGTQGTRVTLELASRLAYV